KGHPNKPLRPLLSADALSSGQGPRACLRVERSDAPIRVATTVSSLGRNDLISKNMHTNTLPNRMDVTPDEIALIPSEPISNQWTSELRKIIGLHPSCKLLK